MQSTPSSGPGNSGPEHFAFAPDAEPHAYDPVTHPELFDAILGRRMIAFLIDASIIVMLTLGVYGLLLVGGVFTLGLTWLLLGVAFPAVALGYTAYTLSQPPSATIGMRAVDLEMRTWYGAPMYALLGAFHALLFYFTVTLLTPLVLIVPLLNERKRCLHDFLGGTVIINNEARAWQLRG